MLVCYFETDSRLLANEAFRVEEDRYDQRF